MLLPVVVSERSTIRDMSSYTVDFPLISHVFMIRQCSVTQEQDNMTHLSKHHPGHPASSWVKRPDRKLSVLQIHITLTLSCYFTSNQLFHPQAYLRHPQTPMISPQSQEPISDSNDPKRASTIHISVRRPLHSHTPTCTFRKNESHRQVERAPPPRAARRRE